MKNGAIVLGSQRADIKRIFYEVKKAAQMKGENCFYFIPSKLLYERQKLNFFFEILFLLPTFFVVALVKDRKILNYLLAFRVWCFFDYLRFYKFSKSRNIKWLFCLNIRHSEGAVQCASEQSICWISHQHGDYYNKKREFRDVEGGGIRLFWNSESQKFFLKHRQCVSSYISGSLKHISLIDEARLRAPNKRKVAELIYLDTIGYNEEEDLKIAQSALELIKFLEEKGNKSVRIKFHPQRIINQKENKIVIRMLESKSIKSYASDFDGADAVFTIDSNSIYDAMALGLPTIFYKTSSSKLSIDDTMPGFIDSHTNNAHEKVLSVIDKLFDESYLQRQKIFLQSKISRSRKSFHEVFCRILDKEVI